MMTKSDLVPKGPVSPLVRIRDVAKLLSISRPTVCALVENGELRAREINPYKRKRRQHLRITLESLLEFYQKRFGHPLDPAIVHRITTASLTRN